MPSSVCEARYQRFEDLRSIRSARTPILEPWWRQVIDLNSGACVHWFRLDGAWLSSIHLAIVPGAMRPIRPRLGRAAATRFWA